MSTFNTGILLTEEFQIESAKCECPRGIEICHHIAATLFAPRYKISKTDVSCSWVPKLTDASQINTVREVYSVKKPNLNSNDDEIQELYQCIFKIPPVGFRWHLRPEVKHSS